MGSDIVSWGTKGTSVLSLFQECTRLLWPSCGSSGLESATSKAGLSPALCGLISDTQRMLVWQGLQWLQPLVSLPLPCVRDNPRVNPRDPLHHPWGLDPMSSCFLFTPSLAGAQIPAPSGVVLGLCSAAHLVGSVAEQRILGVQAPFPGDVETPSVSLGSTWRAGPHPGLIFSRVTCASSLFSLRL